MSHKYFFLEKGAAQGPVDQGDVEEAIESGRIGPFDLVYQEGHEKWKPLIEHEEFRELLRQQRASFSESSELWVVLQVSKDEVGAYKNFTQRGPYSTAEVKAKIQLGEVSYRDYVWTEGMKKWEAIASLEAFNTGTAAVGFDPVDPTEEFDSSDVSEEWLQGIEVQKRPQVLKEEVVPEEAEGLDLLSAQMRGREKVRQAKESSSGQPKGEVEVEDIFDDDEVEAPSSLIWSRLLIRAGLLSVIVFASALYLLRSVEPDKEELQSPEAKVLAQKPSQEQRPRSAEPPSPARAGATQEAAPKVKRVEPQKPPEAVKVKQAKVVAPKPPPVPKKEASYLRIAPSKLSGADPRLIFKTDASYHYPVRVFLAAEAGDIIQWNGYFREVTVKTSAGELPSLELSSLNLKPGLYTVWAHLGKVKAERQRIFVGARNKEFIKELKDHKKRLSVWQQKEKRRLFRAAKGVEDLSKELRQLLVKSTGSHSAWTKAYNKWNRSWRKNRSRLASVGSRATAARVLYPLVWMELRDRLDDLQDMAVNAGKSVPQKNPAMQRASVGAVNQVTQLKQRVAELSLWR